MRARDGGVYMRVRDGGEARGGGAGNEELRECEGWREEIQGEG